MRPLTPNSSTVLLAVRTLLSASALLGAAHASGTPAGTVIQNVAVFDGADGAVQSNSVSTSVAAVCGLNLTPAEQSQTARAGLDVSFLHTLTNTGNATLTFPLTFAGDSSSPNAALYLDRNGNGVVDAGETPVSSVTLAADQSAQLIAQGRSTALPQGGTADWTVGATCPAPAEGQARAVDHLTVQAGALTLSKTVTGSTQVEAGAPVSYLLTVQNPNLVPLTDVRVQDPLPAEESFVSATPAPSSVDGQTLGWSLGTLAAGETRTIALSVTIRAGTADNALVTNTASTAAAGVPQSSAQSSADVRVFTTKLLLSKAIAEVSADVGDVLHYTVTVTNASSVPLTQAVVLDTPAQGLRYVAGSSTLDGVAIPDPAVGAQDLSFTVGTLNVGQTRALQYAMQVTPDAGSTLNNVAVSQATSGGTRLPAVVASNHAQVALPKVARLFGGKADIVGRVYLNRSGRGVYVPGLDVPVARARIVLAGGREVLTDENGLYHFASLSPDRYALRLDPRSVPWAPQPVPGDTGLPGTRLVDAWGLLTVDFPLQPGAGSLVPAGSAAPVQSPVQTTPRQTQPNGGTK